MGHRYFSGSYWRAEEKVMIERNGKTELVYPHNVKAGDRICDAQGRRLRKGKKAR